MQPLAYITDGARLCEVLRVQYRSRNYGLNAGTLGAIIVEDCRNGTILSITTDRIRAKWRLIRAAPSCPDQLEAA